MTQFYNNAVFWVEVDKIEANPFQPRKEFDQQQLQSLADSIRQYGVLQALVVTRREEEKDEGGLVVKYELISGERRLRAARLAGVREVPVLIRTGEEDNKMKLELAIIENIQREDLNVVDRARAFQRLIDEFSFSHSQVAKRVGKSREYVTNTLRVLALDDEILDALSQGKLSEGHARPLGMLTDRPDQQKTLFKEIIYKKLSVREAERIARRVAYDKVRKKEQAFDPEIVELEEKFAETLGTRVHIERKQEGGRISIDYFSEDDLNTILDIVSASKQKRDPNEMLYKHIERTKHQQEAGVSSEPSQPTGHSVSEALADHADEGGAPTNEVADSEPAVANTAGDHPVSSDRAPEVSVVTGGSRERASGEASYTPESADRESYTAPPGNPGFGGGDAPLKPDYAEPRAPEGEAQQNDAALHAPQDESTSYAHSTPTVDSALHEERFTDEEEVSPESPIDDTSPSDDGGDDLYSVRNFTI